MLIKLAANAFTKKFLTGSLSEKALETIKSKGLVRPLDKIIKGMETGTNNIFKKNSVTVNSVKGLEALNTITNGGGYAAAGVGKNIYSVADSKYKYISPFHSVFYGAKRNNLNSQIALRHEAHEISELDKGIRASIFKPLNEEMKIRELKHINKLKKNKSELMAILNNDTISSMNDAISKDIGQQVGRHNNLAVLGREANDVRRIALHGGNINTFIKLRNKSGEAPLLKRLTGVEYGKSGFDKNQLKQLRNAEPDHVLNSTRFGIKLETPVYIGK